MKTAILIIFLFLNSFLFSQDTSVTWIKKIDTSSFKMFYDKKDIPKGFYKTLEIENLNEIANPTDDWTPSCLTNPHRKLHWIAKDKNNRWVISFTYGGKLVCTYYYFFDKEKGKLNINDLVFRKKYMTFGQTVTCIKTGKFKFRELFEIDYKYN